MSNHDFFLSLLVRDLGYLGAWADVDVDVRNEKVARWRAALKQEQDAELQRHKRAIEWCLENSAARRGNGVVNMGTYNERWLEIPSDIADLVKVKP